MHLIDGKIEVVFSFMEEEMAYTFLQPNMRDAVVKLPAKHHENTQKEGTISGKLQLISRNVINTNESKIFIKTPPT